MGMYGELKQISPALLNELIIDHSKVEDAWGEGEPGISLDKAWSGIHFVLTGTDRKTNSMLSKAVLGGKLLQTEELEALNADFADELPPDYNPDEEVYLGYTYYLTPEEVQKAATSLAEISEEDFRNRFDSAKLLDADVYPSVWELGSDKELEDFLLPAFRTLVDYYRLVAGQGNAMFVMIG